eukprot:NODE_1444_length_1952_cov_42.611810_g1223_i0.p1 GENE.NODE_1444_length_1952_cov_42.611810_g1223_i0~~NODE_1444_length_1952_cov_42.611810_g1223_i0.p1  ORF type:complete len:517 (-),score=95.73 NODE_1444_length_1952_cov_42.611810_g1223_i0:400-1908(-)
MLVADINDGRGNAWIAITLMPISMVLGDLFEMDRQITELSKKISDEVNQKVNYMETLVQSNLSESRRIVQQKVYESNLEAEKINKDGEDESDQKVRNGKVVTIITSIIILVVSIIVAYFVNHLIVRPIYAILEAMKSVAVMELESAKYMKSSKLYEIHQMQESFFKMVEQLIEYRSYMPQSVLVKELPEPVATTTTKPNSNPNPNANATSVRKTSMDPSSFNTRSSISQSQLESVNTHIHFTRLGMGLISRKVTILVINLKKFLSLSKMGHSVMQSQHDNFLSTILPIITEGKGVPEPFLGDHVMVSFNAVTQCPAHVLSACTASLRMIQAMNKKESNPKIDLEIGLATGQAEVGNLGCKEMKRFAILGSVVNLSFLLQRLCKKYDVQICTDSHTASNCMVCYYRTLDRINFPKFSDKPIIVQELYAERKVAQDEWMYEINAGDNDDPNADHNLAWKLALMGKFSEAGKKLEMVNHEASLNILKDIIFNSRTNYVDDERYWY